MGACLHLSRSQPANNPKQANFDQVAVDDNDVGIADMNPQTHTNTPTDTTTVTHSQLQYGDEDDHSIQAAIDKAKAASVHTFIAEEEGIPFKPVTSVSDIEMVDKYQLEIAIADSQREYDNNLDHSAPFKKHMEYAQAEQLVIGDTVDLRDLYGRFEIAKIFDIYGTKLQLQYVDGDKAYSDIPVQCDYNTELCRLAHRGTISRRPTQRKEFRNLGVGDMVDINPSYCNPMHNGWKVGEITEVKGGQITVKYEHDHNEFRCWTHFDNVDECQVFLTYSDANALQAMTEYLETEHQTKVNGEHDMHVNEFELREKPSSYQPERSVPRKTEPNELVPVIDKGDESIALKLNALQNADLARDSTHVLMLHKAGWVERYCPGLMGSMFGARWKDQWMVLNGHILQCYEDDTQQKVTFHENLLHCSQVVDAGTLQFAVYKQKDSVLECKCADHEKRESWKKAIQNAIPNPHGDNLNEEKLSFPPHNERWIQTNFSPKLFEANLKCKFIQNKQTHHAELVMYDTTPQHGNDPVIRVDLMFDRVIFDAPEDAKSDEQLISIVRVQSKCWSEYMNKDIADKEYPVMKCLRDIILWCIQYQLEYPEYQRRGRNCRAFMIALCTFLEISFPQQWTGEGLLWKLGASSSSGSMAPHLKCAVNHH